MKLTCVHIDDEQLGRKIIADYIYQMPFLESLGSGKNAFEAIELIETLNPDLVFLDIQMPGLLGTQLLESLKNKPMVIFVTAYEQYAVESYELEVIDYIMKPVSLDRFTKAVIKALEIKKAKVKSSQEINATHFFVSVEYALVKINFDTISHIEGLKDYIKIFVNTAVHPILTKSTLKGIEEKLPSDRFFRVQKSFIVNLEKIESIRNHRINIGKFEIPVSETHMDALLESINYRKT
jgi:two-component system, LytTR family, response regulator